MFKSKLITGIMKVLQSNKFILLFYIVIAAIIGTQQYIIGRYNNFTLFQHSVFHFFEHKNLYNPYPEESLDVFLYNPSFSLFFMPFAFLPTLPGILFWAIFTPVVFFFSIKSLPFSQKSKLFILYLILPELITSVGNLQTNVLITAFIIYTMMVLENKQYGKASFFTALNFFIKGYGAIAGVFFLFKNPGIKTFIYLLSSFIIIGLLPLIFYSPEEFVLLYQQWFFSLKKDYSANAGISIMGVIKGIGFKEVSTPLIQMIGVLLFSGTVIKLLYKNNYENHKFFFLAYVLIWVTIFNQSSESPTYIIASTGAFIWYVNAEKTWLDKTLFVFFFILTVLSPTDIVPKYLREHYVVPYSLKALPCILIWIRIQIELLMTKKRLKYAVQN